MKLLVNYGKRGLVTIVLLASLVTAEGQVMWNLKGGWMGRKALSMESSTKEIEEKSRPDWMIGLELEIPLSEKLNLETGLRYKDHAVLVRKEYDYEIERGKKFSREFDAHVNFEIPLRLTYKQQLGEYFSMHVGAGPYFSTCAGAGWDRFNAEYHGSNWSDIEWKDASFGDMSQVGLETSAAVNWKCLSLGVTYITPCFYKGYKDENKPVVMATLGIRFKSSAWKYVGATLLTIGTVGLAAANAWESAREANQNYSSSGSSSSYRSSSTMKNGKEGQKVNHANWTALEYSYSGDESLLIKMRSSGNYDKQEVRNIQQRMRKTREKIKKQSGHDRTPSELETWVP